MLQNDQSFFILVFFSIIAKGKISGGQGNGIKVTSDNCWRGNDGGQDLGFCNSIPLLFYPGKCSKLLTAEMVAVDIDPISIIINGGMKQPFCTHEPVIERANCCRLEGFQRADMCAVNDL